KYADRPEGKYILGSKFPTLRLNYRKALAIAGGDVEYDLVSAGLEDEMNLGLFGKLNYLVRGSDFLSRKKMYFMDYSHFLGNKTWLSGFKLAEFKNLDYYTYSTYKSSLEGHAELNLGGFLLNKIPFIRKFKLNEIAGFHYLTTDVLKNYMEFTIGVEKFGTFRVELFTSLYDGRKSTIGFLFGIKRSLDLQ
ncbi:MAG TPA: DUF5686 family protein, partial [Bacteroidia bacterium]|nr:DUF5686 family protein [Bacteroidia bacterium]